MILKSFWELSGNGVIIFAKGGLVLRIYNILCAIAEIGSAFTIFEDET